MQYTCGIGHVKWLLISKKRGKWLLAQKVLVPLISENPYLIVHCTAHSHLSSCDDLMTAEKEFEFKGRTDCSMHK